MATKLTPNKKHTENIQNIIDWDYIFEHRYENKYEIPYFYDEKAWNIGETYRLRIANIYDPSKFWIVLKERELDVFQSFLMKFYKQKAELYVMPVEFIKGGTYCIVYVDDGYYRGIIVDVPYLAAVEPTAIVFLFDFGYIAATTLNNIYYLAEKFYKVPRFAVRATLVGIQPQKSDMWTLNVVKRFSELVTGKVLLGILEATDPKDRVVLIRLADIDELSHVSDIGDKLINEDLATVIPKDGIVQNKINKLTPITKYPFLFPTFQALERDLMPTDVYTFEMLKSTTSSTLMLKPYFTYHYSTRS